MNLDDLEFTPVPEFAKDYPKRAETLAQTRLPFYCCNCQRKEPTRYLTPNFGPFCKMCLQELLPLLAESSGRIEDGLSLIATERERQRTVEGWTAAHDDAYNDSELVRAAICYAHHGSGFSFGSDCNHDVLWPFDPSWWKTSDDLVRSLVKAGALIAAEIDRVRRDV